MELISAPRERNLIACAIKSRDAWLSVSDLLSEEDFGYELNAGLWKVISGLHERRAVIDPVLVSEKLSSDLRQQLDTLGGWGYVSDLSELPISPQNAFLEAEVLHELTIRRRVQGAGERIQKLASEEVNFERMLGRAQVEIDQVHADQDEGVVLIGHNIAQNVQQKIDNPDLVPGLKSGFHHLDLALQGFQDGELYVVGARKKTGKSTLLLNWARHLAVSSGIPILWVTTEHNLKLDQLRLLAMQAEVPYAALNSGMVGKTSSQLDRVVEGVSALEKAPMYFKWLPNFSLQKLQRIVRKHVRLDGVKAVFFDLIKPPPMMKEKEWQELGVFTYGMKELAGEENIPIVTAVQINREGAAAQRAQMEVESDYFAGSDRIAQALTVAMVLRKPFPDELTSGYSDEASRILTVSDNRLGPANYKALLQMEPQILTLKELSRL